MEERSVQFFDHINASIHLPSLPHILLKLIELCHDEKSTVKDLSQIIHTDAALSAKVMAAANSVFYGRSQTAIHVEQALTILGLNATRNIVLSASDIQAFSPLKDNCILELKVFWKHSLMCALLSKGIAQKLTYPSPEEAFLTGLLHDIGKLVLRENFPKKYAGGLTPSEDSHELISDQTPHLRFSHSSVGAWLIKRWNLQSFMSDAVLYHHESLDRIQDALPLVKIIYAANALCPETKVETAIKLNIATNILGLETSEIEDLVFQAGKELDKIAQALGIDIERSNGSGALISETDLKIQDDLVRQVKDIVLLQGTLHNLLEARDVEAVLKIVQQGIEFIFDIKDVLFFLYDPQKNILLGKSVSSNSAHNVVNEVSIPLKKGKNLLVHSLLKGCPLDSFNDSVTDNLSITDEQIIGLIGNEGILCLPMTAYQRHMGVIVLGLKRVRATGLAEKKRLLMLFTKQASLALYAKDASQNHMDDGQSEHLDPLSILARKVAHEVNTPLSIIKNYIAVLRNKLPENKSFREEIKIINEEIDRVALLVHELSDATKLKDRLGEPLDLNALISNLIKIFQETFILKPNINAHLNLDASLPMVTADKNHVKQILSNLIINAVEAMPGGGNINIRTRYASNNTGTAPSPSTDSQPGHVEITIKDDGPGIADAVKPRIFKPNITSKGAGHSGLGLSIVYNNVKGLKGDITCESDAEKGTRFKIVFPIAHHQSS